MQKQLSILSAPLQFHFNLLLCSKYFVLDCSSRKKLPLTAGDLQQKFYKKSLKGLQSELSHVNVLFFSFQGYSDIKESTLL